MACCSKVQIGAIVGGVLAALLLIAIVILVVLYCKRQLARSEENKARINARLAGEDEIVVSFPFTYVFLDMNFQSV